MMTVKYFGILALIFSPVSYAACPNDNTPVVDLCGSSNFLGYGAYLDSKSMSNGYRICSCTVTSEFEQRLQYTARHGPVNANCDHYAFSVFTSHDGQTNLWNCSAQYAFSSLNQQLFKNFAWDITVNRTSSGFNLIEEPGFCLLLIGTEPLSIICDGNDQLPMTQTVARTSSFKLTTSGSSISRSTSSIGSSQTNLDEITNSPHTPISSYETHTDTSIVMNNSTEEYVPVTTGRSRTEGLFTVNEDDSSYSETVGMIAGGTVAGFILCCTVAAGLIFCRRRQEQMEESRLTDEFSDVKSSASSQWVNRLPGNDYMYVLDTSAVGDSDNPVYW